jgi:hypothetical protein
MAAKATTRPLEVAALSAPLEAVKPRPRAAELPDGGGDRARRLWLALERDWAAEEARRRWSGRRGLAFIAGSSCLLWGALIWGGACLF